MNKTNFLGNLIKVYFKEIYWLKISKSLKEIKLLVIDVDGVLTDGKIYLNGEGDISKSFNVKDGLGLKLLKKTGIKIVFLSGGEGGATEKRAKSLGIDFCKVGVKNKFLELNKIQKRFNIYKSQTAYVGDDLNDIPVKKLVDFFIVPRDASSYLFNFSDAILINKGGLGAIRELSERILKSYSKLDEFINKGYFDKND